MAAEKEKDVVVKGRVKEASELGAVTYMDPDKTGQPVVMSGITFLPGESVDVDELLNEEAAERLKKKLAGNQYFKVDGGPDHGKTTEARLKHEQEAAEKRQKLAEKQAQEASRQQQPPPDWKGPSEARLEHGKGQRERR